MNRTTLLLGFIALLMSSAVAPVQAAIVSKMMVVAVDYDAQTFTCQRKEREPRHEYRTTAKTVYRINGTRPRMTYLWNRGKFSEIKIGRVISIQYHVTGHQNIAERIVINPD
jgi:hypothetical protein